MDVKDTGNIVLDHDHITGRVRGALHRSCNAAEGKIALYSSRFITKKMDYPMIIKALRQLADYLETADTPYIYYTHKTEEERRDARNAKARKARAEKKARETVASKRGSVRRTKKSETKTYKI